ncbi:hypothetical protein ACN28S_37830 [Cystobacter fuscus]
MVRLTDTSRMKTDGQSTAMAVNNTGRLRSRNRSAGRAEMTSCGDRPLSAMSTAARRLRRTTSR